MRTNPSFVWILASSVLLAGGCSLDFDALERGRADGGGGLDAHIVEDGGADAGRDGAVNDVGVIVDANRSDALAADTGSDAFVASDAIVLVDAGVDAFVPPVDAHVPCATLDCSNPECLGRSCDDGLVCTSGDVCIGAGTCAGSPITCAPNECATSVCTEPAGCHAGTAVADGAVCTGGRCCYGRCSNLRDSGNCAGCGLGCDEYTCSASGPATCVCDTNAGCPNGQACIGGSCRCTGNGQCAAGQTCVSSHCTY